MTFSETTTPSTDPEIVSRSCGDEPFDIGDIPAFFAGSRSPSRRRPRSGHLNKGTEPWP